MTRIHWLILGCAILLTACGVKGGDPVYKDPVPAGSVVASATLTTVQSGKTVSGLAAIYQLTSSGEFVLRLENLSAPSEGNLQIALEANGSSAWSTALRGPTGDQNYSTGLFATSSYTFQVVRIRTTLGGGATYGAATF